MANNMAKSGSARSVLPRNVRGRSAALAAKRQVADGKPLAAVACALNAAAL
jgi:hypothetical protein